METASSQADPLFFCLYVISRYKKFLSKSLILTTNLEFSKWGGIFTDDQMAAAMIDRLIHHSHILVFSGPGHRLEESMQRQRKGGSKV